MFDAIIAGAGPAGVSCALWLKQLGFNPVVVDRQKQCGGLQLLNPFLNTWIASSVNSWGRDVANAMHENMIHNGVQMRLGQEASAARMRDGGVRVSLSDGTHLDARFLVLAGGVAPKAGGFLGRIGMLIGPGHAIVNTKFAGASVAILGGGDSAFENYTVACDRGARSINIFARTLRARAQLMQMVPPEDVIIGPYQVDEKAGLVNGEYFDQILVLYGYEAQQKSMLGLDLAMRTDGFVATNEDCLSSHSAVYAIGELAKRAHPCCTTSMADGVVAAKAIQRRLEAGSVAKYAGMARRLVTLGSGLVD